MNGLRSSHPALTWNEIVGRRQLEIYREPFLQVWQRAVQPLTIRHDLQIDVDRARAPSVKHGRRTTGEVDSRGAICCIAERAHQPLQSGGID